MFDGFRENTAGLLHAEDNITRPGLLVYSCTLPGYGSLLLQSILRDMKPPQVLLPSKEQGLMPFRVMSITTLLYYLAKSTDFNMFKTEIPHIQTKGKFNQSQAHRQHPPICVQHFKCIHFQLIHTAELLLMNEKDSYEICDSLASAHTGT